MPRAICLVHHVGIQAYPYLIDTAKSLAQAGWQVDVLAWADAPLPEYQFQDPRIHTHRFHHVARGDSSIHHLVRFVAYVVWAVAVACRRHYSSFIGFDQNGLIAASLASLISGNAPVLYYSPELHVSKDLTALKDRVKKQMERLFSRHAKAIIVQNRRRADILIRDNGLGAKQVYLVPNAPLAGDDFTCPPDFLPNLLARHGIHGSRIVVLHIGTISDLTRVREIAQTVDEWPSKCILVVHGWGQPEYIEELIRFASRYDPPRIIISRSVLPYDELQGLVRLADIGLALYLGDIVNRYEMASGKLYQYMKAGLPVITSDFPALREVVETNEAGVCIDGEEMEGLSAAVTRLALDSALRQRFGQNAHRAFLEKYAYEKEFAPVLSFLDSLGSEAVAR